MSNQNSMSSKVKISNFIKYRFFKKEEYLPN